MCCDSFMREYSLAVLKIQYVYNVQIPKSIYKINIPSFYPI